MFCVVTWPAISFCLEVVMWPSPDHSDFIKSLLGRLTKTICLRETWLTCVFAFCTLPWSFFFLTGFMDDVRIQAKTQHFRTMRRKLTLWWWVRKRNGAWVLCGFSGLCYIRVENLIFLSLLFCSLLSASNNARHNVETKAMEWIEMKKKNQMQQFLRVVDMNSS